MESRKNGPNVHFNFELVSDYEVSIDQVLWLNNQFR